MKTLLSAIALVSLLSTGSMAEVFSPVEQLKLDICPKQKDAEAIDRCFKRSTFDIIALSVIVEKSAQGDEAKAYANTKLGMIYEIDVGDNLPPSITIKRLVVLEGKRGAYSPKGLKLNDFRGGFSSYSHWCYFIGGLPEASSFSFNLALRSSDRFFCT